MRVSRDRIEKARFVLVKSGDSKGRLAVASFEVSQRTVIKEVLVGFHIHVAL